MHEINQMFSRKATILCEHQSQVGFISSELRSQIYLWIFRLNVKLGGINTVPDPSSVTPLTDPNMPTVVMGEYSLPKTKSSISSQFRRWCNPSFPRFGRKAIIHLPCWQRRFRYCKICCRFVRVFQILQVQMSQVECRLARPDIPARNDCRSWRDE
jgi:hypothetical protein